MRVVIEFNIEPDEGESADSIQRDVFDIAVNKILMEYGGHELQVKVVEDGA